MGAITLDKLVVYLEGDNRDLKRTFKESTETATRETQAIANAFSKMGGGVKDLVSDLTSFKSALITAAGAGGLALLVNSSLEAADEIGKLATQTGLSTKLFQELSFAATQTNVEQGQLNQSLSIFNRLIGDAASGNEEAQKAFGRLGVSVTDSNGRLKSSDELLFQVSDGLNSIENSSLRASVAQDLFGRSGANVVALLGSGTEALQAFQRQANELGVVIEDRLIKSADETKDKLATLSLVLKTQLSAALVETAPAIQTVTDLLIQGAKHTGTWIQGWAALVRQMSGKLTGEDKLTRLNEQLAALREGNAPVEQIRAVEAEMLKVINAQQGIVEGKRAEKEVTNELMAADQTVLEKRQEAAQKEIDLLLTKIESMRALNETFYAEEIARSETQLAFLMGHQDQYSAHYLKTRLKMKADDDKHKKEEQQRDKIVAQGRADTINTIATLQHSTNKELAAAGKAAAIVTATQDGILAVQKALASFPPPVNFIMAGVVGAATAVNVGKIAGLHDGADKIPGVGFGDKIPIMAEPGEGMLTRIQNKRQEQAVRMLEGFAGNAGGFGGGNIVVELRLRDGLIDFIETELEKRNRLSFRVAA